jgi:hypothetical protein
MADHEHADDDEEDDDEHYYDLICPITNEIFEDAVKAEDGRTYERSGIEAWFASLRQRGLGIVSPCPTRQEMGTRLERDEEAAGRAQRLRKGMSRTLTDAGRNVDVRRACAVEGIASIHDLREVFGTMDSVRDILEQTLDGWQPPQLVVIGQESSGKSTVYTQILTVMAALFLSQNKL